MKNRWIIAGVAVVIILVASIGTYYYTTLPGSSQPSEGLKIGIYEPLTGASAENGKRAVAGFTLAAEEINAKGGVLGKNITLIIEDDESKTDVAMAAVKKLITVDNVTAVLGGLLSGLAMAVAPVFAEYKTIYLNTNPVTNDFTNLVSQDYATYKYLFRVSDNATEMAYNYLTPVVDMFDAKSVVFVAEDLKWARDTYDQMEALWGDKITLHSVFVTPGTGDFIAEIELIRGLNADVVLGVFIQEASVAFAKQWHDAEVPSILVTGSGILTYAAVLEGLGEAGQNIVAARYSTRAPITPRTIPFWDAFVARWGYEPGEKSETCAYDGLYILADAIERAGTTETEALITALEATDYIGAMARYRFYPDNHQSMIKKLVLVQWLGDKFYCIWPQEFSTHAFEKPPWVP